jgi:hypothetical protein
MDIFATSSVVHNTDLLEPTHSFPSTQLDLVVATCWIATNNGWPYQPVDPVHWGHILTEFHNILQTIVVNQTWWEFSEHHQSFLHYFYLPSSAPTDLSRRFQNNIIVIVLNLLNLCLDTTKAALATIDKYFQRFCLANRMQTYMTLLTDIGSSQSILTGLYSVSFSIRLKIRIESSTSAISCQDCHISLTDSTLSTRSLLY